jgi:hypothetical protein
MRETMNFLDSGQLRQDIWSYDDKVDYVNVFYTCL